ncbi:MAG: aminodeoxychorismate synthase component I [Draconibacterium sp.]|nr:MAG: aminodeoxychorismate synthase component I [Draconibacterium sp.]
MKLAATTINQLNNWGKKGIPFGFLIDYKGETPVIFTLKQPPKGLYWSAPDSNRLPADKITKPLKKWNIQPVIFEDFKKKFEKIQFHIHNGDTYLLNLTQPTKIDTNLSLEDIFNMVSAPYKILYNNKFVCFSPETFIKINRGKILSYPMKGTIDDSVKNAKSRLLNDTKEIAEHNTIVDLIRNDLSTVAENVTVEKFRFLSYIKTQQRNLWQVSSEISGDLPEGYQAHIGNILASLLPAGSVTGAPKKKTLEIIAETEQYQRGYYTGIFGVFDGKNLDSCVLIRFIEKNENCLEYKSGGGITFLSTARKEYDEMVKKVYVPVI